MAKTLIYFVILAVLGTSIYFFIFKKEDNPYGAKEAGFTVQDTAAVYKIFIASNDNESITAERKDGVWMLNGTMRALPSMVDLILLTVHNQEPLYPVTKNAYEEAVKNMAAEGIKVELYDKNNKKITVFYVGGISANGGGTNMLTEGAKMPYVVQTPGFSGSLRSRFSTKVSDWRDRTVFNIPATDLKSVAVSYVTKPINSFVITKAQDKFTVTGDPAVTTGMGPLNEGRAKAYTTYFTNINCEGYMNGIPGLDSIIRNAMKMSVIDVETVKGEKQHADIYWMPVNKRSKNKLQSDEEVPNEYDADRMYAVINGSKDTVLIQTLTFFKLLRKSFEFYQKDIPRQAQSNTLQPGMIKK